MKGLLKGLRYISDIFEAEKEQEMQIGTPTDVKHVAHIGMDGPATNKPSWMNEFNANDQEHSSDALTNNLQNTPLATGNHESLPPTSKEKKKSRRKGSIENGTGESPTRKGNEKHSRSHGSSNGAESPSQDLPDIPKKSRRKKSKASSNGSDKNGNSLPELTDLES